MKRFFYILLILLAAIAPKNVTASIVVTTTVNVQVGVSGGTTGTFSSSGGDMIVVAITYRAAQGPNLTDNKGNTWTACTSYDGGSGNVAGVKFYYCVGGTFGTGHTLSTTSNFGSITAWVLTGTRTASTPKDQENGQYISTLGTTATPGSITPTANNEIVFTVCMNYNGSAPTIPSGYTGTNWTTGTAYAGGAAYKIQTTASSENPSWGNMNSGSNGAVAVLSIFEPGAAGASAEFKLILSEW